MTSRLEVDGLLGCHCVPEPDPSPSTDRALSLQPTAGNGDSGGFFGFKYPDPIGGSAESFAERYRADYKMWGQFIRETGIKVE